MADSEEHLSRGGADSSSSKTRLNLRKALVRVRMSWKWFHSVGVAAVLTLLVILSGHSSHSSSSSTGSYAWNRNNPLDIPIGRAPNLPSIRVEDTSLEKNRRFYGGKGDKAHLGGFTKIDPQGISPAVWKLMIERYNVHSLLDVGCGRGISTSWFYTHGVDILCVEGSSDAYQQTMLPDPKTQIVQHDYSRGPWWPEKTYDAVWAVEFLEHINVHNHFNYISTFRKAALIFATSSRWDGWHHVEVHMDEWWIRKFEAYGFKYDDVLTKEIRLLATEEGQRGSKLPTGDEINAQHIWLSLKVFVNPVVAALPQHAHLFFELGCYAGRGQGKINHRKCGEGGGEGGGTVETPLDPAFFPISLTPEMDQAWEDIIKSHVPPPPAAE